MPGARDLFMQISFPILHRATYQALVLLWLLWYSDGCFASTDTNMRILVDKASGGAFVYVLKTPS